MIEDDLKKLQEYQNIIFLSEIGALIHDLGKLNDFFIKKQSVEGEKDHEIQNYEHGDILEYDSSEQCRDFCPDDEVLKHKAEKLKNLLGDLKVRYNGESSDLYSFIKDHHCTDEKNQSEGEEGKKKEKKCPNDFVRLLHASDGFDSEEDRGKASDKQSICKTYYSNAFGHEREIEVNYKAERNAVYDYILDILDTCDINKIKTKRREFLDNLRESFSKTLGMTARAANDVTLWEHSYMTASIIKALLCQSILENNFPVVKRKEKIESGKPFRIFSVGWDFFDFVSQSHTIPDVVGRIKVLEEMKERIKNLIEAEFLLGNCIYEDDYGLHFLVPAAFDDKGIIKEKVFEIFNEKTNGVLMPYLNLTDDGGKLTELLPNAIDNLEKKITKKGIDFVPKWTNEWKDDLPQKKLICRVCGKGFYREGDKEEICETCNAVRKKGREEKSPQTRFIDEIAWNGKEYENVALVVLNFDLGNWLNGDYIKGLFMRKYDDEDVSFLFDYYKNEDEIDGAIKTFRDQGALSGWIDKKAEGAKKKAEVKINRDIENFENLSNFSQKYLVALPEISRDILTALKSNHTENAKKLLGELNKTSESIKKKLGEVVDRILNPDIRWRNKEKEIIRKAKSIKEIKEKIFLKNPSPSRLMRVWNNTNGFFVDLEEDICKESFAVDRYKIVPEDEGKLKDFPQGPALKIESKEKGECVLEKVNKDLALITVTPHLNKYLGSNLDQNIEFKLKYNDLEADLKGKIHNIEQIRGYRIISSSPDLFMFLVSAAKTFDIIKGIKNKYTEQFGKVYGKLPLNTGVIYFKRKSAFFVVLDSARRFMGCFKVPTDFLVKEIKDIARNKILIDVGEIELPCELGNGKRDYYHPYIIVEEGGIALSDITEKHLLSLERGDKIRILPSFFDFQFLDANTRRFDIGLNKENKRTHDIIGENGPRPYVLDDLEKFHRLEEIFDAIGSWTPIKDIEALAISKRQEWGEEGELGDKTSVYEELIDSALENKISGSSKESLRRIGEWKEIKSFLKGCIMEGSFFDAIELFKSIMKMDLRGDVE